MADLLDRHYRALLLGITVIGLALRLYRLTSQPLSWDEGWSLGLSALSRAEIDRITALDVHPPAYYYVLKLWLGLGKSELVLRMLSVVAGTLVVPGVFFAAMAWLSDSGRRGKLTGLLAALLSATSPFLVYYSQVGRMYALCASLCTVAAGLLFSAVNQQKWQLYVGFVLVATASLYTFYYSTVVIAAALAYVLATRSRRWRELLTAGLSILVLYVPWLARAIPPMLERIGARTGSLSDLLGPVRMLADGLFGLVFAYGAGWAPVYATALLWLAGVGLALRRRDAVRPLVLPSMVILLALAAVLLGSQAHMFAARYLIVASPFLALGTAWSVVSCGRSSLRLGVVAVLVAVCTGFPSLATYVYEKPYEVGEAFDPEADYRFLKDRVSGSDIVFYNVLSLGGHYERFRSPDDAPWSYVLRWDPVTEPLEYAVRTRVLPAASVFRRLWFVLYKGTVGPNLALKEWLDLNLYPASGQWREDILYLQYLPSTGSLVSSSLQVAFGGSIVLKQATYTASSHADGPVTVELQWAAGEEISQSYKIFVHLYDEAGQLVAQHDAVPVNELRPTQTWRPSEVIVDRHGLWVPPRTSGVLRLVVGIYDPETGARLRVPGGADHVQAGLVQLVR